MPLHPPPDHQGINKRVSEQRRCSVHGGVGEAVGEGSEGGREGGGCGHSACLPRSHWRRHFRRETSLARDARENMQRHPPPYQSACELEPGLNVLWHGAVLMHTQCCNHGGCFSFALVQNGAFPSCSDRATYCVSENSLDVMWNGAAQLRMYGHQTAAGTNVGHCRFGL